jgi:hypothetical protein
LVEAREHKTVFSWKFRGLQICSSEVPGILTRFFFTNLTLSGGGGETDIEDWDNGDSQDYKNLKNLTKRKKIALLSLVPHLC